MRRETRLLIADQHRLFGEACKQILEPEFKVVEVVTDGHSLMRIAAEQRPDILILDVALPRLNEIDAAEQVVRRLPSCKIILTSANADPGAAGEAFRRAASAYVLKQSGIDEFLTAIRMVGDNSHVRSVIGPETIDRLPPRRRGEKPRRISSRQSEILQLLAEGKSRKEVGIILNISPRTVSFHKYDIMERLGIKTDAELLRYAMGRTAPSHAENNKSLQFKKCG
jgi:DNA-binding NarL/FixJ family response regulator